MMPQLLKQLIPGRRKKPVPGFGNMCTQSWTDSETGRIATYTAGPDTPEVTVVFVHGFTLAAESFFLQVRYLRDNFPRVRSVLMDLRGHGKTGEVDPRECTVDGSADDVCAVIEKCAPTGPLILVGHSLGGMVALSVIRRAKPELLERIKGLILIATAIESLSSQGLPQILASPVASRAYALLEESPDDIAKFRTDMADLLAPTLAAAVFKRWGTSYDLVKFHADMMHETPLATFAGFFHDLQSHDEVDAAPRLRQLPGFVIVGVDDHYTPLSQSQAIAENWPRAELVCTKHVGHMLILEAPEVVNKALSDLLG